MPNGSAAIRDPDIPVNEPAVTVDEISITAAGRWPRIASVRDEDWLEGDVVTDAESCIRLMRQQKIKADIFTFAQKIPDTTPRHPYFMEWDNVAAIAVTSHEAWWNNDVSTDLRKDVRRSQKRGVVVREVEFGDELVHGIVGIYNETPVRQGRLCQHYGKDFSRIKAETSTFPERSTFIGAYLGDDLVGFAKIVFVNNLACILHIMSLTAHTDKRPSNAIISKAVEICEARKCSHLTYGKYCYGNNTSSSLTSFKHRNGFKKVLVPRYYVPLTGLGKALLNLELHHGIRGILPESVVASLVSIRRSWTSLMHMPARD